MTALTVAERGLLEWLGSVIYDRQPRSDPFFDDFASLLGRARLEPLAGTRGGGRQYAGVVRKSLAQSSVIEGASTHCIDILRDAGIAAVTLKGPALAAKYWGDVASRVSTDVDLLVAPASLVASVEALEAQGYRSGGDSYPRWYETRWHYHRTLHRVQPPSPTIELHWAVARPGLTRVDVRAVIAGCESVRCLYGSLPAPVPHWQLMLAALHAVRHHFPLREVVDVALISRSLDDAGWSTVVSEARRAAIGPALYYSLWMCSERFGGDMPAAAAAIRPPGPRDAVVRRYLGGLPVTGGTGRATLRLGKVVTPLATSSYLRLAPGLAWSLTDHPRLAGWLDRKARGRVSRKGGA